jgi:tryptophan synthase alpha chain
MRRPILAPFLMSGFPTRERFRAMLQAVAPHADAIEIGLPHSDPIADGPVLRDAARRAIAGGTTLAQTLEDIAAARANGLAVPVFLMSYYQPLAGSGAADRLVRVAKAGVDGLIVPDLPHGYDDLLRADAAAAGLGLVPFVAPTTSPERLAAIAASARAHTAPFIYLVSVLGTTGDAKAQGGFDPAIAALAAQTRAASGRPVILGFGIRDRATAAAASFADGVIVGTALAQIAESPEFAPQADALLRDVRAGLASAGPSDSAPALSADR